MKSCKLILLTLGLVAFALAGVVRSAEAAGETSTASLETIEQEAVSLLNEYLRVDTTNPPGNEIKAAQFFKDIFDREGIEAQIIEAAPGRGNIYQSVDKVQSKHQRHSILGYSPTQWSICGMPEAVSGVYQRAAEDHIIRDLPLMVHWKGLARVSLK
jgi:hypothetical protein